MPKHRRIWLNLSTFRDLSMGSTARLTTMIIAGLLTLMIIGAAFEQRSFEGLVTDTAPPQMGGWALAILQTASALGVLSMVLIQSFKQSLRGRFHFRALRQWLCGSSRNVRQRLAPEPGKAEAFAEILDFIAPSYRWDILALPIEQLSAQLASVADVALLNQRGSLLHGLAGEKAYPDVVRYIELLSKQSELGAEAVQEKVPELLELRNTLSHIIQRRIDGFQIHVGNEWKSLLRIIAVSLSASLAALGILVFGELAAQPFTATAFALIVGLLGGLLASVARDIIAIVERYRR